jgi:beta-phosphoglucomutase
VSTSAPRAIIFDLDGVITDTAEQHYRGWQRLADEEGIPFDRDANEALRGLSRRESLLTLLGDRELDEASLQELMARKNGYYVASLADMGPQDTLPGAVELVEEARRRGLKVAIGSSSKNARLVLERLGLLDRFDAIADGHTVENAKPAPDLFLAAAELVGEPSEACVVVEDAASGVDAALAAGMIAVGVGPAERVGHAHRRFDTTADIDLAAIVDGGDA